MELHLPTFYLAAIILTAAMATVMAAAALRNPVLRLVPTARALGFSLLAFVLFRFRVHLGEPLAVLVGNMCLSLALSEYASGLLGMLDRRFPMLLRWAPVLLVGLVSLLFLYATSPRQIGVGLLLVAQAGILVWTLLQYRSADRGVGYWFLVAGVFGCMGTFLLRALALAWLPDPWGGLDRTWLLSLFTVIVLLAGAVFMATGTLVMALEHQVLRNLQLAMADALTGLPNRRHALDALARAHSAALRAQQPLGLLMVDVDRFKEVNDTYGHPAGDAVLVRVGAVLRKRLRAHDLAARFGGEEFLVLLPATDSAGAQQLAEALRQAVAHERVEVAPGKLIGITVSVGLSAGLADPDILISCADEALYQAKADGRNCVRVGQLPATAATPP
ncbi:GGDEF domain-containing protein [Curvibacter sp. APW13]|uniref:GGDEF domain-containing protein n=1 Tax=Curvibacter sp. APW13 TaxID=3077236 RepID=UPI0028DFC96C|nr:GGDEF domain-containing protein [Curvibacter sp. APW13]MDT8990362.1 GGDEF domain-containing protein [Curvibacter sp. APW13]